MKTLNKVETKFSAIEDNGGGLHLAVFEGSQCVAFFSGFELNLYSLVESINYLDEGFCDWEGNAEEPQAVFDNLTSNEYGWDLVADNEGIYADKMGAAAQREFDVETD